jgi:hypothetical protein
VSERAAGGRAAATPRPGSPGEDVAVRDPASWRDPAGFVFRRDGRLYRCVATSFADEWDHFTSSGLCHRLIERQVLVPHEEADLSLAAGWPAHRVIRPEPIDLVTYPYEWSFSQLKDAALLTLRAQAMALEAGMTLRDASAFNVQFRGGRPVLIDSTSFGRLVPGRPWLAYRQFCEHFLAPLALMARVDIRLGLLQRASLEGTPLDLAARLLPTRTRLSLGLGPHIHLHARAQRRHADAGADGAPPTAARISAARLVTLVESLTSTIEGLRWEPSGTAWADYADRTSYDGSATEAKEAAVGAALAAAGGRRAWDLGANTGRYSLLARSLGYSVVALDADPAAVERAYLHVREQGLGDIQPLLADLADPSPATGWGSQERLSLLARADADVVLALALVHHLAIGRNVPLAMIAALFARLARDAIVEFVPKADAMVERLLATREDVFADYTVEGFRAAFERDFVLIGERPIAGTHRTIFHWRRRGDPVPTTGTGV